MWSKHLIPTVTCINAINEVFVELQTPNGLLIKSLVAWLYNSKSDFLTWYRT